MEKMCGRGAGTFTTALVMTCPRSPDSRYISYREASRPTLRRFPKVPGFFHLACQRLPIPAGTFRLQPVQTDRGAHQFSISAGKPAPVSVAFDAQGDVALVFISRRDGPLPLIDGYFAT